MWLEIYPGIAYRGLLEEIGSDNRLFGVAESRRRLSFIMSELSTRRQAGERTDPTALGGGVSVCRMYMSEQLLGPTKDTLAASLTGTKDAAQHLTWQSHRTSEGRRTHSQQHQTSQEHHAQ